MSVILQMQDNDNVCRQSSAQTGPGVDRGDVTNYVFWRPFVAATISAHANAGCHLPDLYLPA